MRKLWIRICTMFLVVVLTAGGFCVPSFADGLLDKNSFILINQTDVSISEIYFHPAGTAGLGRCRNNTWIRSDLETVIEFTDAELLNQFWDIRIGFSVNGKIAYKEWEDIELQKFIEAEKVSIIYDDIEGYCFDLETAAMVDSLMEMMGKTGNDKNYFTMVNMSGYDIAEFYIYASNSKTCGKSRNDGKVEFFDSFDVQLSEYELTTNVTWNMKIGLYNGRYISYLVMEGFEMDRLLNCESVVLIRNGQNFGLYYSDEPFGF